MGQYGCQLSWHIYFINGIMNFIVYKDILEQQMIPSARDHLGSWYILVQENDQTHTVKIVVDFLVRKKVTALDLPPQRPNLNVIDNLC